MAAVVSSIDSAQENTSRAQAAQDFLLHSKKVGLTHAIREKLNFLDERLWKRFSARRLELIDSLELSTKKASDQEFEIKKVAETLRIEFNFDEDAFPDFDKLVRAAVQSVRRNRKRSTKSKRSSGTNIDGDVDEREPPVKKLRVNPVIRSVSPQVLTKTDDDSSHLVDPSTLPSSTLPDSNLNYRFISEISKLNSDSQEDTFLSYPKTRQFSTADKSKLAIDEIVQPRVMKVDPGRLKLLTVLPPFSNLNITNSNSATSTFTSPVNSRHSPDYSNPMINSTLLNYFERSKTCSEIKLINSTENLEVLGQNAIACSCAFMFEKSFDNANISSVSYLRNKLNDASYIASFYRGLDPNSTMAYSLNDKTAVLTLDTLVGGCIKDFGFESIMYVLCECFYQKILQDYPLISRNSIPFRSIDYMTDQSGPNQVATPQPAPTGYSDSLNSLAAVASEIQETQHRIPVEPTPIRPDVAERTPSIGSAFRKAVTIKFLSSQLEFSYPTSNSATPKLMELIENAKSAFKLSNYNDSQMLGVKNLRNGYIITCDADLEKIFQNDEKIELEIFTHTYKAIPIYEITSAIIPSKNYHDSGKIILPPPLNRSTTSSAGLPSAHRSDSIPLYEGGVNLKFLSNLEDSEPPPPILLPRFQPLL